MTFSLTDIKKGKSGAALRGPFCQKCLLSGHFSYECTSKERPYQARPSRTAQLKKPIKLGKREKVVVLPKSKGLANSILEQRKAVKDPKDFEEILKKETDQALQDL